MRNLPEKEHLLAEAFIFNLRLRTKPVFQNSSSHWSHLYSPCSNSCGCLSSRLLITLCRCSHTKPETARWVDQPGFEFFTYILNIHYRVPPCPPLCNRPPPLPVLILVDKSLPNVMTSLKFSKPQSRNRCWHVLFSFIFEIVAKT